MGKFEKFPPTGYDTPGYCRRFIPKSGSGSRPAFTCAATTVVGTVALIQSLGWKKGVARSSPFSETLAEDCRAHPSLSGNFGWGDLGLFLAKPRMTKKTGTIATTRSREISMK